MGFVLQSRAPQSRWWEPDRKCRCSVVQIGQCGFLILPSTAASFLLFLQIVPTVSQARITRSTQFSSFVFCLAIARVVVFGGPAFNGSTDVDQCHELSRVVNKFQKSSHNVIVVVKKLINKKLV